MLHIIVVMPLQEHHKEMLESCAGDAELYYCTREEVTEELMAQAEVVIGNLPPDLIRRGRNLRLVQLNSAGTDGYTAPGVLPEGAVLCNATGAYGLAIAEHMLGLVLELKKKLYLYRDQQKMQVWKDCGTVSAVYGSTTLVIGLGDIGGEFGRRMRALGSHVIGVVRTARPAPDYVDELCTMEDLPDLVGRADIITSSLPGGPSTYQIYDEKFFAGMKPSAIFINVGRGNAVKTDALLHALQEGKLAGAALDVTDPEPLPAGHPLWNVPNVLITPHIAGGFHLQETWDNIVCIAARNLSALVNGTPMVSVVDLKTGYRKH